MNRYSTLADILDWDDEDIPRKYILSGVALMLLCAPFPESEVSYLVTDLSRNKCRMADVTYEHPLIPFAHPNVIQHDTIQHKYNNIQLPIMLLGHKNGINK
jgi:hypothetical protein